MGDWTRAEKISVATVLVTAAGSLAALVGLWIPSRVAPPSRSAFTLPPVTWEGELPDVRVAYDAEQRVVGFEGIRHNEISDGCSGSINDVVTIVNPTYTSTSDHSIDGFIAVDAAGRRLLYTLDPRLAQSVGRRVGAWIPKIISKDRRLLVTYVTCGSAGPPEVDRMLAESIG